MVSRRCGRLKLRRWCAAAAVAAWCVAPFAAAALTGAVAPDAASEDRILALDPEHISAADVRDVLAHAPAPRIINLQGSLAWVTMQPFAEFLVAMGYP